MMIGKNRAFMALAVLGATLATTKSDARQVRLDVSLANPTLLAGTEQTTYIKVGLTGFELPPTLRRAPVNVTLVLDKSGSMAGSKIEQAKQAVIQAIHQLGPEDIVSVIAYDTTVRVVVPATKMTDRSAIQNAVSVIQAGGNTALFAGVSKGAAEVQKFLDRNRVNRVILLSDGLANVGPSAPSELGSLGASLMSQGIAVSTLGLGLNYNEDLMFELAGRSNGNHYFVQNATELASVFHSEFRDVLSVVAQEVTVTIHCAEGIRPIRLLGFPGEINGRDVVVQLNQLYSRQEKYVMLEVAVPESQPFQVRPLADVEVTYANMGTRTTDLLSDSINVRFDPNPAAVEKAVDAGVMSESAIQIANIVNEEAVALRDAGKLQKAKELLESNVVFLNELAKKYNSERARRRAKDNYRQLENLDDSKWKETRKEMREQQLQDAQQRQAPR